MQKFLPRVWPDRVAKQGSIVTSSQSIRPTILLVRPSQWQVGHGIYRVADNGSVPKSWSNDSIPSLGQGIEQLLKITASQDELVAVAWHKTPTKFNYNTERRTPVIAITKDSDTKHGGRPSKVSPLPR